MQHLGAFVVGVVIGFLGGLFGKGGSAIATPLLSLIGFPGFIAVASPLPATIPGTLIASAEYWHSRLLDWENGCTAFSFPLRTKTCCSDYSEHRLRQLEIISAIYGVAGMQDSR